MSIVRKPVESSNIASVGWANGELHVEFHSGAIYLYEGVSKEVYKNFLAADSAGKFFNKNIKDNYEFVQI